MPKISVITPSYRQLSWLKRCVRSVADQEGVEVEHIIQDAGTGSELEAWVAEQAQVRLFVEKDSGMYDAINRGFHKAKGDILGYLNCDEQYLPGTLERVTDHFERHPECDMLIGDALIVDAQGNLLAYRKTTPLRLSMIMTDHFYALTCAVFFRRRILEQGLFFDPAYRVAGDAEWICRVLVSGLKIQYTRAYFGVFALTGGNLSAPEQGPSEMLSLYTRAPLWARKCRKLLRGVRHLQKWLAGGYRSGPIRYRIFADEESVQRTEFYCAHPTFRHPWAANRL